MGASMNIMRRMPPSEIPKNIAAVTELIQDEEIKDDVLIKTDQPIQVGQDEKEGKPFLLCEYNKDGDSYRSPWTNQYFPPLDLAGDEDYQPMYPTAELLSMEQKANEVLQRYAKLYYDSNYLTSVYFFDTDIKGFGCCWLIKKTLKDS